MRRLIRPPVLTLAALGLLVAPGLAEAHAGHHHQAPEWTFAPGVVIPLALTLVLYMVGWIRLAHRSSLRMPRHRAGLFLSGWAIMAAALVSPLHEAGEHSFTLHMIEHELIMLPAALLLVASRPGPVLLWGLPAPLRQGLSPLLRLPLWRWLAAPLVATGLQAAALVGWHMPALFNRALTSEWWHVAQHASFAGTALLFWWAMLPRRGAESSLVASICLFVTSMVGSGLGALMALSASPWYPAYAAMGAMPFGLSPEMDQQLAGVIMWVPGGLFHLGAALILLARSLMGTPARRQPQKLSTTA
jgi:cytochrome c oxidase assembly factor CtaG